MQTQSKLTRLVSYAGLVSGVALAGYFLANLDLSICAEILNKVSLISIVGVMLCICSSVFFRSLRWSVLAGSSMGGAVRLGDFWRAVNLGYLGNMLFPAKAGEAMRMAYVCKRAGLPAPLAISTGVLDRLLDVVGLLLPAGLVLFFSNYGAGLGGLLRVFPFFVLGVVIFLCFLASAPDRLHSLLAWPVRLAPTRFRTRLDMALDKAMKGSAAFQNPGAFLKLLACTLVAATADCCICLQLFTAFGWSLPLSAAPAMALSFAVGGSLPSAPGYLGVYQGAAVLILAGYGIEQSAAVLYAFAMQFCLLGTFLILNSRTVVYLLRRKLNVA